MEKQKIAFTFLMLVNSLVLQASPYCLPTESCWPNKKTWQHFEKRLKGKLIHLNSPLLVCKKKQISKRCQTLLSQLHNPFFIESIPSLSLTAGWLDAWQQYHSVYAVEAKNAADIAKAIRFAHRYRIKIAIKGTGHDYLGRSTAKEGLLIWTHAMRGVHLKTNFVPMHCKKIKAQAAVTVEAGTRWLEAYKKVTVDNGLYVQGGGCTSVGAAGGFPQGGGYGSFSKEFGTAASNILQAEIVTADSKIRTVNACQDADLFWAIKGGGGGTFGVVTKLTMKTHLLPHTFGILKGKIKAKNDKAYQQLIKQFIQLYASRLNNRYWGEQVAFSPDNTLSLQLLFHSLSLKQVHQVFAPFYHFIEKNKQNYRADIKPTLIPARKLWDIFYLLKKYPELVAKKSTPFSTKGTFWWASNQQEVSWYIYQYQSRYLPFSLFKDKKNQAGLAKALFKASRITTFSIHFNKGQSGANINALIRGKSTAMHPKSFEAVGLLIVASGQAETFLGVKNHKPDKEKAKKAVQKGKAVMAIVDKIAPNAGTYANEADYFENNWQQAFWGENYPKLLAIKNKYDKDNVFNCHHCVGSE